MYNSVIQISYSQTRSLYFTPMLDRAIFLLFLVTVFLCLETANKFSWQETSFWKLPMNCLMSPTPRSAGSLTIVNFFTKSLNLLYPGWSSHTSESNINQSKSSSLKRSLLNGSQLCSLRKEETSGIWPDSHILLGIEDRTGKDGFCIGSLLSLGIFARPTAIQLLWSVVSSLNN